MTKTDFNNAANYIAGLWSMHKYDEARSCYRLMLLLNNSPQFDVAAFRRKCFPAALAVAA